METNRVEVIDYTGKDLPIINQAVRERWPINDSIKNKVLKALNQILDKEEELELKLKASNTIAKIDSLNLQEQKIKTPTVNINVDLNKLNDSELDKRIAELEAQITVLENKQNKPVDQLVIGEQPNG